MKKMIALLLATVFGMTTLGLSVGAEETPTPRDVNDYLTVYYDFEGTTQTEQLRDKAPAGNSVDSLRIDDADVGQNRFTFENGTVKNNSVAHPTLIAAPSADLKQVNEGTGGTWFLRFKVNEQPTRDVTLLYLRNLSTSRAFHLALMTNGNLQSSTQKGTTPSDYANPFSMPLQYELGEWINLVCVRKVVNENGQDQNMIYYYAAQGEPSSFSNYTYLGRLKIGTVEEGLASSDGIPLYLFNYDNQTSSMTAKFELDEVRFYSTDLTDSEVGALLTAKPEPSPEPVTPPADTEPPTGDDAGASDEPSRPETEPPEMEIVDPESGGTPTLPKLPEATTEEPTPTLPQFDDYDEAPNRADDVSDDASGCALLLGDSIGIWLLFVCIAVMPMLKRKKSTNCTDAILDQ